MESAALTTAIDQFLAEDLAWGDSTTQAIFSGEEQGKGAFIARQPGIAAGLSTIAPMVFERRSSRIRIVDAVTDGTPFKAGDTLLTLTGPITALLTGERVALNLAQRLCGIATLTKRYVDAVSAHGAKIVDTRKTTPGLRMMEKYAVRVGGGGNHRFNLSDGVLIKDNHIAACGSIANAVVRVQDKIPHTMKIEVEAGTLDQVRACLACGVDIIMLDNMDCATMTEAVKLIAHQALVEASGGITLENVAAVAATGVDLISIGALTHSAPALDISMQITPKKPS